MEDLFIILHPFSPFGTCGWGSQPHTAIIAVWHFILIVCQYIVCSGSAERYPELDFKGTSHAFWCYLWYHNQKSMSSRFRVLSGSCLTAGGHAASFINQVCIMLVNSFTIPGCITNGAGQEARACAFSCFRAHNMIVCSSGVCLVPFFALAISRASLNSGLSREHVCCHVFLPARVFLSSLLLPKLGGHPSPMEERSSMWVGSPGLGQCGLRPHCL